MTLQFCESRNFPWYLKKPKTKQQKTLVGRLGNNGECYSVDKRNNI